MKAKFCNGSLRVVGRVENAVCQSGTPKCCSSASSRSLFGPRPVERPAGLSARVCGTPRQTPNATSLRLVSSA
jgi:hypothetical protein